MSRACICIAINLLKNSDVAITFAGMRKIRRQFGASQIDSAVGDFSAL